MILWHDNEHHCVHVYIYGCMYVGLCMLWVTGRIIFNIFEAASVCLDIPLSIFGAKTTQRAVPAKTCENGKKDEGRWSVRSETLEQKVRDSIPRGGASRL